MIEEENGFDKSTLDRVVHMNAVVSGIVTGMMCGMALFLATIWLVIKGGVEVGPHLALLDQFFIGYQVSLLGSLVGFVYASILGGFVGYSVARLYNWVVDIRTRRPATAKRSSRNSAGGNGR